MLAGVDGDEDGIPFAASFSLVQAVPGGLLRHSDRAGSVRDRHP